MPQIEDFDTRHDILIYTTIAEEFRLFAPTQADAAEAALEVCRRKWRDRMVVKHEVIPMTDDQLPAAECYKCEIGKAHVWHDNGDYNG
jgi:hypothetical protein